MSNPRATILYAEDDLSLGFVTQDNLELAGFRVVHCTGGSEALEKFQQQPIDVCLLDVMLPEMDGFALAREIRLLDAQVPILFLTAKSLKEDRIVGFTLGGDDYVTKPFSIEELILKINVFLRRSQPEKTTESSTILIGNYRLDIRQQTLIGPNVTPQNLTYREAQLLVYFARQKTCFYPAKRS